MYKHRWLKALKECVVNSLIVICTALHYFRYQPPRITRNVLLVSKQQSKCRWVGTLHWIQDVLCYTKFSTWQPNNLISNIRLVSDSRNKRITSKLRFISSRLQSGTMNNRSQGTKTEIEKLSGFYVSAVVRIHRELIKIHWLVTVLILWLLSVKWLG